MSDAPTIHRTSISTPVKRSILQNHKGEPEQLLLIQWMGSVLLCVLISWNAAVDAYLGQEPVYDKDGIFVEMRATRYKPIGADTLLFLLGLSGGSGTLYSMKRSQDKRLELEKEKIRLPKSKDPLDTDPGDPDARI